MKVSRIIIELAGHDYPRFAITDRAAGLDLVITPDSDGWLMRLTPEERLEVEQATQERGVRV